MKLQAMPVQPQAKSEMAGTQQSSVPKEDFLSILKKQTTGSSEKTKEGEKDPVKRDNKKVDKKSNPRDASQNLKEAGVMNDQNQSEPGTTELEEEKPDSADAEKAAAPESGKTADTGKNALMSADELAGYLNGESGQNLSSDISSEVKKMYRLNSILSGTNNLHPVREEAGLVNAEGVKDVSVAEEENIFSSPVESAGKSGPEVFLQALDNRVNQAKSAEQLKDGLLEKELQTEMIKTAEGGAGTSGGNLDSGTENSGKENSDLSKWFSLDQTSRGDRSPKGTQTGKIQDQDAAAGLDYLDELQKKAEQSAFLPFERLVGAKLSGGSAVQVMSNKEVADATPLPDQLRTGIEQGISKQLNQFTIRLKPEGLGEILVHMTSTGGKIALSIGVSNLETQKLLSSEMMHLKETMQPLNAEVQEIYHNSQGGMDMMNYEQGFFNNRQRETSGTVHRHMAGMEEEAEEDAAQEAEALNRYAGVGRLSAYI